MGIVMAPFKQTSCRSRQRLWLILPSNWRFIKTGTVTGTVNIMVMGTGGTCNTTQSNWPPSFPKNQFIPSRRNPIKLQTNASNILWVLNDKGVSVSCITLDASPRVFERPRAALTLFWGDVIILFVEVSYV